MRRAMMAFGLAFLAGVAMSAIAQYEFSEQRVLNAVYDPTTQTLRVLPQ